MTYDDIAAFHVQIEEPVRVRFREYDIYTCGPWCQGPGASPGPHHSRRLRSAQVGHNSPAYVHLLTEALKLAFADREAYYGDPEFVDVPMQTPVSPVCRRTSCLIRPDKAIAGMPPAGDPRHGNGTTAAWGRQPMAESPATAETLDTSYVCAVDRHGNIFSATPSDTCVNAPITPAWASQCPRAVRNPGRVRGTPVP